MRFSKKKLMLLIKLVSFGPMSFGQSFVNLDFEQSSVISTGPYDSGIADVPGWTEYNGWGDGNYDGGSQLIYNNVPLDDSGVCLVGNNDELSIFPLQGDYSVFLLGGSPDAENSHNGARIGQIGQIPVGTTSITYWGSSGSDLNVTFSGNLLSFSAIESNPNYTIYQADISAYAGQTGELLFTAPWPNGSSLLENIEFSTVAVPEPNSLAILASASALLFAFNPWRLRS